MRSVPALREESIAAWQAIEDFYQEHKAEDGSLPAEHDDALAALNVKAQAADKAYAEAAANEGIVQTARERLSMYHEAVKGRPLDFSRMLNASSTPGAGSLGSQFIGSDTYNDLVKTGALRTDKARIGVSGTFESAATDVIHTGTDGPANALVRPTYLPDIIPLEQRPRTIRGLFDDGGTIPDGPILDARQVAFDNAAAAVGQATSSASAINAATGLKPQSSIAWEPFTTNPITIATWMATTRQALANPFRIRGLIDSNIRVMLELAEEEELLTGPGTGVHMLGLLEQDGIQTFDANSIARDTRNLDAIRVAKRLVRTGPARVRADAVVVNPEDSEGFDLMLDDMGRYRAGDPFGNGAEDPPIWRLPRVESEAVDVGTAIVGAFKLGGTVYQVQAIVLYVSDSHEDFFVKNLIAILGEERLALVIRRPTAFVEVTLADWEVIGS